jgi:hypothetical protein
VGIDLPSIRDRVGHASIGGGVADLFGGHLGIKTLQYRSLEDDSLEENTMPKTSKTVRRRWQTSKPLCSTLFIIGWMIYLCSTAARPKANTKVPSHSQKKKKKKKSAFPWKKCLLLLDGVRVGMLFP